MIKKNTKEILNKAEETLNGANQAALTNHRHKHETAKTFMTFHYYKLHAICVYVFSPFI